MSDENTVPSTTGTPESTASTAEAAGAPAAKRAAAKKTAAKKTAAKKTAAKKATAKKAPAKKATAKKTAPDAGDAPAAAEPTDQAAKKATARRTAKKSAATPAGDDSAAPTGVAPLFQAPDTSKAPARRTAKKAAEPSEGESAEQPAAAKTARKTTAKKTAAKKSEPQPDEGGEQPAPSGSDDGTDRGSDREDGDSGDEGDGANRRRRRRGGRRRRKGSGEGGDSSGSGQDAQGADADADVRNDQGGRGGQKGGSGQDDDSDSGEAGSRRRRRRRRAGEDDGSTDDDPKNTVTRVRKTKSPEDQITSLSGSTRLEAKKQRRREGREAGRRRAPIVSEAEFLARRESVERVMAIRQRDDLTQIAVLEDKVLVEHYVARESQTSLIGNVYLGRVQNVLPSMEAAFIDIGKGRNAVLYAGEVNWQALGHKDGQPRKIESVLSSGQSVLVQVTKDPMGHKGARLTSQVSLAGRFLVYVPDGTTSGISRKLPDTERTRLKSLLKEIVPDSAGVIVRTAAEGASEDELTQDVERLKARWEDIEKKSKGQGPKLLYGEPDLTLKVVRDLFTEDFANLVIQGDDAWDTVKDYVDHVAPDLVERLERYAPGDHGGKDVFAAYRVDEQIAKGLDRKVWLPSGGSLVIDRTEAMTVVDVNTGKFTGSGGNLEETVTKNNLEAAEEMVRQLRLRDIGGIIVIDFIDMVLESNRDLVLRRLVECLGRDRTRHQVAEVTSLGLVQMTRKRIGTGLLEAFSESCSHCGGRGLITHDMPVEPGGGEDEPRRGSARRSRGNRKNDDSGSSQSNGDKAPSPKDVAKMPRHEAAPEETADSSAQDAGPEKSPAQEAGDAAAPAEPPTTKVSTRTRSSRSKAPKTEPREPIEQPESPAEQAPDEESAESGLSRPRRPSPSRLRPTRLPSLPPPRPPS